MEFFLIYPVFIGMSVVTAQYAREKGYSGRWWFLIASLAPLVSLLVLFLLKRKPSRIDPPVSVEDNSKVLFQRDAINGQKILL